MNREKDSVKAMLEDYAKNMEDHRSYLKEVFNRTDSVESEMGSEFRKLFPNAPASKESGHPLLKIARATFMDVISDSGLSPIYSELAYRSFCDEIEKIANK